MTSRPNPRRQIGAWLAILAVLTASTSYAVAQVQGDDGAAWLPVAAISWLLLFLAGVWTLTLCSIAAVRALHAWRHPDAAPEPVQRPAPGTGGRAPSATARDWQAWETERQHWLLANAWATSGPPHPKHAGDRAPILGAETTAELYADQYAA